MDSNELLYSKIRDVSSLLLSIFLLAVIFIIGLGCNQPKELGAVDLVGKYWLKAESATSLRLIIRSNGKLSFQSWQDVGGFWRESQCSYRISESKIHIDCQDSKELKGWMNYLHVLHIRKYGDEIFLVPAEHILEFDESLKGDSLHGYWKEEFGSGIITGFHAFLKVKNF